MTRSTTEYNVQPVHVQVNRSTQPSIHHG